MLGGGGYYRGSTVLISGTAGSGKTSVAAHFADAVVRARRALPVPGPRRIAVADHSQHALDRARSRALGEPGPARHTTARGRRSTVSRPTWRKRAQASFSELQPRAVIFDPISSLLQAGTTRDAGIMLTRLIDFLKVHQITVVLTDLTSGQPGLREHRGRHLVARRHLAAVAHASSPAASATARCPSSSHAAWRTRIRCASSC